MSHAKISDVTTIIVDVPTIRPHALSMTSISKQSMVLVWVSCDDGIVGVGEAATIGGLTYGAESPESIKVNIDTYMAPVLKGQNAAEPAAVSASLNRSVVGNHFAKNAIECALWDAEGKRQNKPVYELLGGANTDRLPVLWTLASGDTARDIDEAHKMLSERRFKDFKLKIGRYDVQDDIIHVAAIRDAIGPGPMLTVDINQAWSLAQAKDAVQGLYDAGVALLEQPLPGWQVDDMAELSRISPVRVMADEALQGPRDAARLAKAHAASVFSIKIAQSGGLLAAGEVAATAKQHDIDIYGGTMLEGEVGTVASLHLFATFDAIAFGTELFGPLLQKDSLLDRPLDYSPDGLALPEAPGLGLYLDLDKLEFYRRDRSRGSTVTAAKVKGGV